MSDSTPIFVAIVDDDASLCRSLGRLLKAAGIKSTAYPSVEALLAGGTSLFFDCLVLDVQLDGMSGVELIRHLAGIKSAPPVVLITAHDEPAIREEAIRWGCSAYLKKTDSGEKVLAAIRRAARPESALTQESTRIVHEFLAN